MKNKLEIDNSKSIPEPTLRRLPLYYQYLKRIQELQNSYISCTQIANDLNLVSIQVRKDLEMTGIIGKPKLGYPTMELMKAIEQFLGWNDANDAFLAGVGHLGYAILGYKGFKDFGINIVAAFDSDPQKIGKEIHHVRVLSLTKMHTLIQRMKIKIGILTVPAEAAQEVADIMISAGIRAIWNFAPVKINIPSHIIVQHENLAASLGVLSKKLRMQFQQEHPL